MTADVLVLPRQVRGRHRRRVNVRGRWRVLLPNRLQGRRGRGPDGDEAMRIDLEERVGEGHVRMACQVGGSARGDRRRRGARLGGGAASASAGVPAASAVAQATTSTTCAPVATALSVLVAVRAGRHVGYDRLVLEFRGRVPGHTVGYVRQVLTQGQGKPIPLAGGADLEVVVRDLASASAYTRAIRRTSSTSAGSRHSARSPGADPSRGTRHSASGCAAGCRSTCSSFPAPAATAGSSSTSRSIAEDQGGAGVRAPAPPREAGAPRPPQLVSTLQSQMQCLYPL